jgi:beta-glucosidase
VTLIYKCVTLSAGERQAIEIPLLAKSLAYWNEARHTFVLESGQIELLVGGSSADIRLRKTVNVNN